MSPWTEMAIQVAATAFSVVLVLAGFWRLVVRPYLDRKVAELMAAADDIEPKVTRGVKQGVSEAIRNLPENALGGGLDGTVKESTRQFLKFGSGLFENGLSSFLGDAADLERRSGGSSEPSQRD